MATFVWIGNAGAVAQVDKFTPANVEVGDIFTLTCGSQSVSFTATAATVANVTAGLANAWNNSTIPQMTEMTASDQTTYMDLTADSPGKPFTVTSSATNGGAANTQTLTRAAVTANAGPNVWSGANFDVGSVPGAADDVIIDGGISNSDILYDLDQSGVGIMGSCKIINNYSGKIGLPEFATANGSTYREYRQTSLYMKFTSVLVISSSSRLKFNTGNVATSFVVKRIGSSESASVPCLIWISSAGSNTFVADQGDIGICPFGTQTTTIATLRQGNANILCGPGVTITNVIKTGGSLDLYTNTTSVINSGGSIRLMGTASHSAITNNKSGFVSYESSGTLTTYTGNGNSVISFDASPQARTLTNCTLNDSASLIDTGRTVTHTNAITLYGDLANRVIGNRQYAITPA